MQQPTTGTVFALKIRHPLCSKNSSFKAIRAEQKRIDKGEEYLEFSGETLEQRRVIRALSYGVSLDVLGAVEMTM